ncbi:serine O-acetyltransferase [Azoarcus sp. CIB]|nr:serine O-acetyltransferase [Azoarcus sp. CIB]
MIGSGAKILGPVKVGRFASIGANAVVLADVPDYGVAVGIPAKVVRINVPDELPDYFSFSK